MLAAHIHDVQFNEVEQVIRVANVCNCNRSIDLRIRGTRKDEKIMVKVTWDNVDTNNPGDDVEAFDILVNDLGHDIKWSNEQ